MPSAIADQDMHDGFLRGDPQATHRVQGWIDGVVHLGRWNFEDAEGVAQEVLVKLLEVVRRDGWQRRSSFKTFVFSVAKYTCIDAYRRERLRGTADRALHEAAASEPASQVASLERQQRRRLLRFIVQQLPSECLRLWGWTYREGLGAVEVGRRLGITAGNARVRAHRCLQKARVLASEYEAGPIPGGST